MVVTVGMADGSSFSKFRSAEDIETLESESTLNRQDCFSKSLCARMDETTLVSSLV